MHKKAFGDWAHSAPGT